MTANVSIIISSKKDILRIPNAALRFTMPDKDKDKNKKAQQKGPGQKGASVWIIENGKPKRISISTGVSDGSYTELISGEIKEGQEVIVESLKNKTKVWRYCSEDVLICLSLMYSRYHQGLSAWRCFGQGALRSFVQH